MLRKLKEYLTPLTLNGAKKSQELWSAQIEQDLKSASLELMWTMSNLILTRYVYSDGKYVIDLISINDYYLLY